MRLIDELSHDVHDYDEEELLDKFYKGYGRIAVTYPYIEKETLEYVEPL